MRLADFIAFALVLVGNNALAQAAANAAVSTATSTAPVFKQVADAKAGLFLVSISISLVLAARNYARPAVTFDRDWLPEKY